MSQPQPLRLFIALPLPETVERALTDLQQRFKHFDSQRAVRWTAVNSIHLTLKFLGDTSEELIPTIESALRTAVKGQSPFGLQISGAGSFPNLRKPRVVWAGLSGDLAALTRLQTAVEANIAPLGYPAEDRPFVPHLTLGRARQTASITALAALGEQIKQANVGMLAQWEANEVYLMRSELKPTGAIYTQLAGISLTSAS